MKISPWILGSGHAGKAAAKSLACLGILQPELEIAPARWLERTSSFSKLKDECEHPLLIISNPHGLHAQAIIEAAAADIRYIVAEKPACVNLQQIQELRAVNAEIAVLHVYRNMWGPQALRTMIESGELGALITIEGRYWQASAAERARQTHVQEAGWKDDISLSGAFDVYLDVASHWFDMLAFLFGENPQHIDAWLSYQNSGSPHRDSHVQATAHFSGGRPGFGSVSKTVHGATNHFEVNVLGTMGSATWIFENPDVITVGIGRERRILPRQAIELGSQQPPFHGTGWLEGYIEIFRQVTAAMISGKSLQPAFNRNLELLQVMLEADFKSAPRA